jgi:two-component system sensor histidine kinase AlgZ
LSSDAQTPLEVLWQPRAMIWAILAVLGLSLFIALAPGGSDARGLAVLERFGLFAMAGSWVMLLTLATLWVMRRWLERHNAVQVAWAAIASLVWATCAVCLAAKLVVPGIFGAHTLAELLIRGTAMALTVGILGLGAFLSVWRNVQLRAATRAAEHAALQARVDPHFLFNTLNTALSLVRQQPQRAEELLFDLSDLFRAALAASRQIPLRDELWLCRRYLEIERLRMGDRLRVSWVEPVTLPELLVPALLVQPLVENAIRHGVEPAESGGEICVEVAETEGGLSLQVTNPLPPRNARIPGHLIGLDGVRSRLATATQGAGRLETRSESGRYVARITWPRAPGQARGE